MKNARWGISRWIVVAWLMLVSCEKGAKSLFAQEDKPENLTALIDTIAKTAEAGDLARAGAMVRSLIVDEAALTKALVDGVGADVKGKLSAALRQLPADDAQLGGLIKRGDAKRTQVAVHGATTEEIRDASTPAAGEFPGGAVEAAKTILRPGVRFYEVEFVVPGEDTGMKYHLFFWDGARWRMLGPVWRSLS